MLKKYQLIDYYTGKAPANLDELYPSNVFQTKEEASQARKNYLNTMVKDRRVFNILVLVTPVL